MRAQLWLAFVHASAALRAFGVAAPCGRIFAPRPARTAPPAYQLDQHDVICFEPWFALIFPDVSVFPPFDVEILREPGEPTQRAFRRHNAHWLREHAPSLYPEAPI